MTTQPTPQTPKSTILAILQDRPIAYHPILAKALGGVKQAVFVSQLLYWTGKGKRADGFIWKTQEEWTDETGLSAYEQRTARKHLVKSGVLQEKLKSVPARLYYRLNTDVLQTRVVEYHEQVMKDLHNKSNTTLPAIPEITSEITTQEEPPLADSPPVEDFVIRDLESETIREDPEDPGDTITITYAEKAGDPPQDPTFWTEGESPPEPSSQEAPEKHIERLRDELGTDPLQVAAVVVENRAAAVHPDGGDASKDGDPWVDITVKEWARISGKDFKEMSIGTKLKLAGVFRKVGAIADSGAVPVAAAIGRFPGEHKWWAETVGFEWPSDTFCNKLGMMLVPDVQPDPPPVFTFVEPDWLGVST